MATDKEPLEILRKTLESCPVCNEPICGQIFQCIEQHLICSNCAVKCTSCQTCRRTSGFGRARALEALSACIPTTCKFDKCKTKLQWQDKNIHEEKCKHRPWICAYPCTESDKYCTFSTQDPRTLVEHLKTVHSANYLTMSSLYHQKFVTCELKLNHDIKDKMKHIQKYYDVIIIESLDENHPDAPLEDRLVFLHIMIRFLPQSLNQVKLRLIASQLTRRDQPLRCRLEAHICEDPTDFQAITLGNIYPWDNMYSLISTDSIASLEMSCLEFPKSDAYTLHLVFCIDHTIKLNSGVSLAESLDRQNKRLAEEASIDEPVAKKQKT